MGVVVTTSRLPIRRSKKRILALRDKHTKEERVLQQLEDETQPVATLRKFNRGTAVSPRGRTEKGAPPPKHSPQSRQPWYKVRKEPANNYLYTVLPDGAWKGRRCFIIGGGPSLNELDLNKLTGELVITINRGFEKYPTSAINIALDGRLWEWITSGKLGGNAKQAWDNYKGHRLWLNTSNFPYPPDIYLLDAVTSISTFQMKDGIGHGNNTGYGALNLAACLGANPIYLLGYDMHGDGHGRQAWWHDGYPQPQSETVYSTFAKYFNEIAPKLKRKGFKVINLNPKSKLNCFEFGDYNKVVAEKAATPKSLQLTATKTDYITAITPTGDRQLAFALCKHWMETQTVKPDQWLVIDDGKVPITPSPGMDYVRREPKADDPAHTLNVNIQAAIPHIKGNKVLIIEDDEYYAPGYVEALSQALDKNVVAGIGKSKYYHLPTGGFVVHANTSHASFAQTGFRSSFVPVLNSLVSQKLLHYLDICLWKTAMAEGKGHVFYDDKAPLYVGIKGLTGRAGIGIGHKASMYRKRCDTTRELLKNWIPEDYKVYMDIIEGKLTTDNCETYFPKITGITVCQNTKAFMERAYTSIRKFHPDMPIIIIDGSDADDPCATYVKGLQSDLTTVLQPGYNIGHGNGMCLGIDNVKTPYALIFDSDIKMLKSPVDAMFAMMEPDTFGVGYTEKTAADGFEWGARAKGGKIHNEGKPMKMLHPYFQLINVAIYHKFHPYVHHGAPCYLTALDIHNKGLTDKIIKEFTGLGHSSGKGWSWVGKPREFIHHDPAGTRTDRKLRGLGEIEGNWVKR